MPVTCVATDIPGVKILEPRRFGDERGFFSETWNARDFAAATGVEATFVQDNHALSGERFTLRGLHFQIPPHAQGKLVRVTRGAVLDVVVDIRRGSPSFGRHAAVALSAENWRQLWAPPGVAHGYCTLEDDVEVLYKTTGYYAPEHERGLAPDDPALAIAWPASMAECRRNARDQAWPTLAALDSPFAYQPR